MGITSLNDKYINDEDSEYKTTGKEVRYRSSAKFKTTVYTPKITGPYHYYASNGEASGGFGAFWESTDGEVSDLIFKSTEGTIFAVNERSSQVQTDKTDAWNDFEIDLTGKPNGRLIFYVRRYNFSSDFAIDDIVFQPSFGSSVSFDPSLSATRSNDLWLRTGNTTTGITSYSAAQEVYLGSLTSTSGEDNDSTLTFSNAMGTASSSDGLRWNYKTGETGSTGTGPDNAADNNDNTCFLYFEGSGTSESGRGGFVRWKNFHNIETGAIIT